MLIACALQSTTKTYNNIEDYDKADDTHKPIDIGGDYGLLK